jgi:Flp pilus assembly protein TadG
MMSMRGRAARKGEKGVAALEFAFALPILMVVLFAIIEFGMAFYRQQVLTSAVREAARWGIVAVDPPRSDSQIQGKITEYLGNMGWDTGKASPSVSSTADTLQVEVTYPASFTVLHNLGKMVGLTIDAQMPLNARIVMERE